MAGTAQARLCPPYFHDLPQHLIQHADHLIDLAARHIQRRHEAQRVRPRRIDQHAFLERRGRDRRSDVAREIEREQQALAAHAAAAVLARQPLEVAGQINAGLRDLLQEAELADLLHDGAADRGREGIAVEGAALVAMLEAADVLMRHQRADRNAAAEPLAPAP